MEFLLIKKHAKNPVKKRGKKCEEAFTEGKTSAASKQMKSYSKAQIIRKIQNKTMLPSRAMGKLVPIY